MEKKKLLLIFLMVLIHGSVRAQQGLSLPSQNEWSAIVFLLRTPNPGLADTIFRMYQQGDYSGIYRSSTKTFRKLQSEDAIIHYFTMLENNFGGLRHFEQKKYFVYKSKGSKPIFVCANYSLQFDSIQAETIAIYKVINRKHIRISSLALTLDSGIKIPALDTLTKRTLQQLKTRDYQSVYDSASSEYKSQTSFEDFQNRFDQADSFDPESLSSKRSQFGFDQGHYLYSQTWYSVQGSYSLTLVYAWKEGVFRLKEIDISPIRP